MSTLFALAAAALFILAAQNPPIFWPLATLGLVAVGIGFVFKVLVEDR